MRLRYRDGAQRISLALPVQPRAHGDRSVRPFVQGFLPEGEARRIIAFDLGIDANDDMAVVTALGRDCAGALSFLPEGASAAPLPPDPGPPLTEVEVGGLLRNLPTSPLGVDGEVRVSLAGVQSKLLLTKLDGAWRRPLHAPSTHLLKPAHPLLGSSTVANEAFCMQLAGLAGIPVATTTVVAFDGVEVVVSERYDRSRDDAGRIVRRHQEDACQAMSIPPALKYQTSKGGPSLAAIARLLGRNGGHLPPLLQQVTFNVIVGNADCHGKNVSLLHLEDGTIELAPAYDVMSTRWYGGVSTTMGMSVNGAFDVDAVGSADLITEARRWGMLERTARHVVADTIESTCANLDGVDVAPPDGLAELISSRVEQVSR